MSRSRETPAPRWYHQMTLEQLKRMRFRTSREMRNGFVVLPAGTLVTVDRKHGGHLDITAEPCACCGVQARISRVPAYDLSIELDP